VDFVNRHGQEYTGLSSERTDGWGWREAVHPEDVERNVEKWRASPTTGEPFEDEVRYRRAADAQYRWFLSRAVPLRDHRGKIVKWFGTSTDIEDRMSNRTEAICGPRRTTDGAQRFISLCRPHPRFCKFPQPEPDSVSLGCLR
jgi:PAS domain S-box-containing protein